MRIEIINPHSEGLDFNYAGFRRRNESAHNPAMGLAGRYTIELFEIGGEGAGLECVLDSDDRLDTARALYQRALIKYRGRLVMLCDRASVLARSDRSDTMPR